MNINPYQSPSPAAFSDPPPLLPQRPIAGTVFGILNLVLGLLGLCGVAFSAVVIFVPLDPQLVERNPGLRFMHENASYRLFTQVSILVGFVAIIAQMVGGLGLLLQKPYGRQLSIGYAIYGLLAGVVSLVISWLIVYPGMVEQVNRLPPGPERSGAMGGVVGDVCGGVVSLLYPALLLYFMYRPNIVAAYRTPD